MFTPTELAGVLALYALFLGVIVYRELNWSSLRATLVEAASSASAIMFLLAAGTAFSTMVILEQAPQRFAGLILGLTDSPIAFLLLVNMVVLLSFGKPMELLMGRSRSCSVSIRSTSGSSSSST